MATARAEMTMQNTTSNRPMITYSCWPCARCSTTSGTAAGRKKAKNAG